MSVLDQHLVSDITQNLNEWKNFSQMNLTEKSNNLNRQGRVAIFYWSQSFPMCMYSIIYFQSYWKPVCITNSADKYTQIIIQYFSSWECSCVWGIEWAGVSINTQNPDLSTNRSWKGNNHKAVPDLLKDVSLSCDLHFKLVMWRRWSFQRTPDVFMIEAVLKQTWSKILSSDQW